MEQKQLSELVKRIRREFGESDAKRDAALTTPEGIQRYDNIIYGKDFEWNVLDVYRPKNAGKKNLPVILNVHGGGWVYGTKEVYQFYCMDLALHGFAVVNFTYRLAPEHKFPASVEDTNAAVEWVLKNAAQYGFDVNNFFATGDSAGAHLLSMYAAALTNKSYAKKLPCKILNDFKFKAVALNCGKYTFKDGTFHDFDLLDELIGDHKNNPLLCVVETVDFITENFPPVFVTTCDGDFLKAHAPILVNKLCEKNVPFDFKFYCEKNGSLWHCFQSNIQLEAAKKHRDDECNFFLSKVE